MAAGDYFGVMSLSHTGLWRCAMFGPPAALGSGATHRHKLHRCTECHEPKAKHRGPVASKSTAWGGGYISSLGNGAHRTVAMNARTCTPPDER
eukprot:4171902-Pleurochrysis_carterae.AAC.1